MAAATRKTWLEVALNGSCAGFARPHAPVSVEGIVEQGVACARAGAAIVQVHAYDVASGLGTASADLYHRIIAGIRAKVDAIVYPGMTCQSAAEHQQSLACIEELAKRGVIEWAEVEAGSFNVAHYDELNADRAGSARVNSESLVRDRLTLARRHQMHPVFAIYEPGFLRMAAALHWRESTPTPIYRLMFSRGYTFGFPPEDYGVTAYLNLLDQVAPGAQWMISGADVDILPLTARVVMEGGHVRVGLKDAPFQSSLTNLQWVEQATALIENIGAQPASAEDVRRALSPEDHPENLPQSESAMNL